MTPTIEASCECTIPDRVDCERLGFPNGCYYEEALEQIIHDQGLEIIRLRGCIAATIEDCARVAEGCWLGEWQLAGRDIAARIRALKSESKP